MRTLLIGLLLFALINFGYLYFLCDAEYINVWEIRFYLGYVVIIGITMTFGILRIYNAVVTNTRFLMLLRKSMQDFSTTAKDFVRDVATHNRAINSLKTSITNLANKVAGKK